MSSKGKWFVLCRKADAPSIAEIVRTVEMPSNTRANLDGEVLDVLATVDGETGVISVYRQTAPEVRYEAAELAEEYGAGRKDQQDIATYDARYVLEWDLDVTHVVFNAYYTLASRLAEARHGVAFNAIDSEFVDA